jgi:hypothetical protein
VTKGSTNEIVFVDRSGQQDAQRSSSRIRRQLVEASSAASGAGSEESNLRPPPTRWRWRFARRSYCPDGSSDWNAPGRPIPRLNRRRSSSGRYPPGAEPTPCTCAPTHKGRRIDRWGADEVGARRAAEVVVREPRGAHEQPPGHRAVRANADEDLSRPSHRRAIRNRSRRKVSRDALFGSSFA